MADGPFTPKGGWGNVSPRAQRKIQKGYERRVNKLRRTDVLPVAAATAGQMRGIAKSAEKSLDEKGIRDTQGIANRADANLKNVTGSLKLNPLTRFLANRAVKKNTRTGFKEGQEVGKQIFKSPGEMDDVVRKDIGR